jgi:hypothetical protein
MNVAVKLAASVFGVRSCYEIQMYGVFAFDTYFINISFLQNGENRQKC